MKGMLELTVLKLIEKKPRSGYAIAKELKRTTGWWQPSCGSLYPVLIRLHKERKLKLAKEGRRKIYSLTDTGRSHLKILEEETSKLRRNILKNLSIMRMMDEENSEFYRIVKEALERNEVPFHPVITELGRFKKELAILERRGLVKKKSKEIREIIREAIKKLRELR